jgi:hypothetical protein
MASHQPAAGVPEPAGWRFKVGVALIALTALVRHSPDRQPVYLRFVGRIALRPPSSSTKKSVSCLNGPRWPVVPTRQRLTRASSDTSGALLPSGSAVTASACGLNIARPALVAGRRSSPGCA